MVDKKGQWEAKKEDFVLKILGSFSNWIWEAFQIGSMEQYTALVKSFLHFSQMPNNKP